METLSPWRSTRLSVWDDKGAAIETATGGSRPVQSRWAGRTEPSWPGPSACTSPWTRTRYWAGARCLSHCTWRCRHPPIGLEPLESWIWNLKEKGKQTSCHGCSPGREGLSHNVEASGSSGVGLSVLSMGHGRVMVNVEEYLEGFGLWKEVTFYSSWRWVSLKDKSGNVPSRASLCSLVTAEPSCRGRRATWSCSFLQSSGEQVWSQKSDCLAGLP